MKRIILAPWWFVWKKALEKYSLTKDDGTAIVIIGFARSGTSLLGQIVGACGVHFGEEEDMKKNDFRNPRGFFEHNDIFKLSRHFLKEAGFSSDLPEVSKGFRAKNFFSRIKRSFTRFHMLRTLKVLSRGHVLWGFKNFPTFFYFWKGYLKQYKTIGIYRNPAAVAISYDIAWPASRYTFDQIIGFWTLANRDLIYHMISTNGLLICYEDLLDPLKRRGVLEKIIAHIGVGNIEVLEKVVSKELNRAGGLAESIDVSYPYTTETREIRKALEFYRV